jgi:hypothetical protein
MRESATALSRELEVWRRWPDTASRDEAGWQSDAPNWNDLLENAQTLMLQSELSQEEISLLDRVLLMSEEGETLADFLKDNYDRVAKNTIRALARSSHSDVRWQIYDSLVVPDDFSQQLLVDAMDDAEPYVRRRAFLPLLSLVIPSRSLLERAASDSDSVICRDAQQLLQHSI